MSHPIKNHFEERSLGRKKFMEKIQVTITKLWNWCIKTSCVWKIKEKKINCGNLWSTFRRRVKRDCQLVLFGCVSNVSTITCSIWFQPLVFGLLPLIPLLVMSIRSRRLQTWFFQITIGLIKEMRYISLEQGESLGK